MDVREVSKKAKEYFQEVKGVEPLAFDIDRVTFDDVKKMWTLECSFYRNPLETKRLRYTLFIDETGKIKELTNGENGLPS